MKSGTLTGLDSITSEWPKGLGGSNIGLVVHPASVDRNLIHAADICFSSKKFRLKTFFGPQHGIRGETQDNMIEWSGFRDKKTGLQVYSLYGRTRKPTPAMLKGLDVMVVDLQDVGSRYYTFIWTLALVMEACSEAGLPVVVLDRPNPINGADTEGPILDPSCRSFVGLYPLPVRHGMTIGEIASYLKENFYQRLALHIIPMKNWRRDMWFDETGLPWVLPSPNMPTLDSATVYPGMCLLEGTNISEGRGTTRPFEIFGAPWINNDELLRRLQDFRLPAVHFRPISFLPTFQKYAGKVCHGAQIHVLNRKKFRPFLSAVGLLKAVSELYHKKFEWKKPPYEYEEKLYPIDILTGSNRIRTSLEAGAKLKDIEGQWTDGLRKFKRQIRANYLIYK